jgi:hypothetical protein
MTKIFIVEEITWDHHENVALFLSKEKAEAFCNKEYKKAKTPSWWEKNGYGYSIEEYTIND